MRLRVKILLPFAIASAAILTITGISSPASIPDAEFLKGKQLEAKLKSLQLDVYEALGPEVVTEEGIQEQFTEALEDLEAVVDQARQRHYAKQGRFSRSLAIYVFMLGLVVSFFASWRSDVSELRARNKIAEQDAEPDL